MSASTVFLYAPDPHTHSRTHTRTRTYLRAPQDEEFALYHGLGRGSRGGAAKRRQKDEAKLRKIVARERALRRRVEARLALTRRAGFWIPRLERLSEVKRRRGRWLCCVARPFLCLATSHLLFILCGGCTEGRMGSGG